jgi:hypothetical protein
MAYVGFGCFIPLLKHDSLPPTTAQVSWTVRGQLKCDGTHAETRLHLSGKRTSPFKSSGTSVQSTTSSRGVHISGSNAGYTMFRGSVKGTGYPLHSPVSPSLPVLWVTVCHHISTGAYHLYRFLPKHGYASLLNVAWSLRMRSLVHGPPSPLDRLRTALPAAPSSLPTSYYPVQANKLSLKTQENG